LATVLPSIRRVTTEVLPRFGSAETIIRPVDPASAVPIETAHMRPSIRKILHMEMYFDVMASTYARNGFLANVVLSVWDNRQAERRGTKTGITRFRPNEKERTDQSKLEVNHVPECYRLTRVPKSFMGWNGIDGNR